MSGYDVCIVGGGLVGLSTAEALQSSHDGISIAILEKEQKVALHQSGRNSGVVHSGLYYKPGSLKAKLCAEGREATYAMAEELGVPARRSGKLVVAVDRKEIPRLDELERRGRENGLEGMDRLGPDGIRSIEPNAAGVEALYIPQAGVVDFAAIARVRAKRLTAQGASVLTSQPVVAINHESTGVIIRTPDREIRARCLVNCAGLQADLVAHLAGANPKVRIVPFRGEYYTLTEEAIGLVRSLIYPVPDPRFPFLGVHFTRRVDGGVDVGPNAVLAIGREHYKDTKPEWKELIALLGYPGFRKLAARHAVSGIRELVNSMWRRNYARSARRLVPALRANQLSEGGVGIRAQAVDRAGRLVDDFVIETVGSTVHVLNAPSPGATASPAIGRYIAMRVEPILRGGGTR
ncbi:MAG: L-2-hydroxyglutarate oxidase [Acidimicrobiia bacterium]|nr:L-2-hydroxyglutarate oxidase [Acidimicrobiia bacterium]